MISNSDFDALRDLLVTLYPAEDDGSRLAREAGLDRSLIDLSGKPINRMENILAYAAQANQFSDIFRVACKDYPNSEPLQRLKETWQDKESDSWPPRVTPPNDRQVPTPSDLHERIRRALIECGPVDDDAQLKALFAHDLLRPWRHRVPEAANPSARVNGVIAFLEGKSRAHTGENALVLLLRVAGDQLDPGDECRSRLLDLANELESKLARSSVIST